MEYSLYLTQTACLMPFPILIPVPNRLNHLSIQN